MRDDKAQMMLLTAIILLLGFVALAGMVARVAQIPQETLREQRGSAVLEATAMTRGLENVMDRLASDIGAPGADYDDAVAAALGHIRLVESSRGYWFKVDSGPTCTVVPGSSPDPDTTLVSVTVTLSDGRTELQVTVGQAFSATTCP